MLTAAENESKMIPKRIRPPRNRDERLDIRIDRETKKQLTENAKACGIGLSEAIRRAVTNWNAQRRLYRDRLGHELRANSNR